MPPGMQMQAAVNPLRSTHGREGQFFSPHYRLLPDASYLRELLRPWKLSTFAAGMAWLLYGALHFRIADWDVGVSILMGTLAYICAPWTVLVVGSALAYRPRAWPMHVLLALCVAVLVVDTSYVVYHWLAGNQTFRLENFKASAALYGLCGTGWLYRGTLRSLLMGVRRCFAS